MNFVATTVFGIWNQVDQEWFLSHPDITWYVRDPIGRELEVFQNNGRVLQAEQALSLAVLSENVTIGSSQYKVLVLKLEYGMFVRFPFLAPFDFKLEDVLIPIRDSKGKIDYCNPVATINFLKQNLQYNKVTYQEIDTCHGCHNHFVTGDLAFMFKVDDSYLNSIMCESCSKMLSKEKTDPIGFTVYIEDSKISSTEQNKIIESSKRIAKASNIERPLS